jgi:hypothetical protein
LKYTHGRIASSAITAPVTAAAMVNWSRVRTGSLNPAAGPRAGNADDESTGVDHARLPFCSGAASASSIEKSRVRDSVAAGREITGFAGADSSVGGGGDGFRAAAPFNPGSAFE